MLGKKFLIFSLCFISFTFQTAMAAESWLSLPNSNSNILFSVDENSLTRENDIVKFKERLIYVRPELTDPVSGKMVKEKIVQRVMNCKARTQAYMYAALIAENGKRLEEIFLNEDKLTMTAIPSQSLADTELENNYLSPTQLSLHSSALP